VKLDEIVLGEEYAVAWHSEGEAARSARNLVRARALDIQALTEGGHRRILFRRLDSPGDPRNIPEEDRIALLHAALRPHAVVRTWAENEDLLNRGQPRANPPGPSYSWL
jgi:hypothetical protein